MRLIINDYKMPWAKNKFPKDLFELKIGYLRILVYEEHNQEIKILIINLGSKFYRWQWVKTHYSTGKIRRKKK